MTNRRGQEIKKSQDLSDLQAPTWGRRSDWEKEPMWSEVLPGLWQGGTDDWDVMGTRLLPQYDKVPRITKKDFDTVVTLYAAAKPVDWHVRELRFGMWDSNLADVDFEDLFDLVDMAYSDWIRGKRVLIRCQAGWNRSGLIMALVLIRDGYEPAEAISLIRRERSPYALCNPDFVSYLMDGMDPEDWRGSFYKDPMSWSIIQD
jgi:protein-tyrosine phosphatase